MKEIVLSVSVILYFISFIPYISGIIKGKVKPRPLSWLGWSMLLGIGIFAQINEKGLNASMAITVSASIGCFVIFLISILKNSQINKSIDYICFLLGIICMIIYLLTKDALFTTLSALLSDVFVGIPTIWNAYKNPRSEDIVAWGIGTFAIFLSFLVALTDQGYLLKLYPAYLFGFNALIFVLCLRRLKNF